MPSTPLQDDDTAGASRVRTELPGADHDHITANLINAAIDLEHAHQQRIADGSMKTTSALIRAEDNMRVATRAYLKEIS